jgi:hypothetical protein
VSGGLLAALLLGSCKPLQPLPEVQGGIELGLRRGGAWSTLTVRPPYVVGPMVNLQLRKGGAFVGTIDQRSVSLQIDQDGIKGSGPRGTVALDVEEGVNRMVIDGTWNGSRVHFDITEQSLKGTIAVYQVDRGATGPRPLFTETYTCQYVLDKVEKNGGRSGISICSGLPEQTLLEVPSTVQNWLTRKELAVVLLSLLSAPPYTVLEGQGRI